MQEDPRFQQLKELLLRDEWEARKSMEGELSFLNEKLISPDEVKKRVHPFIEEEIAYLRDNFPELYGEIITQTIKQQIRDSQDEVVDALYPIIGKLIRKFIIKELEKLSERVDEQVNSAFSWEGWKKRFRAWFSGVKEEDLIMRDMMPAQLEEVFLVQRDSGLLLGSFTIHDMVDQDMTAGMLTALAAFSENIGHDGPQDLQEMKYGTFKLLVQNYPSYYFAAAVSGLVTEQFKEKIGEILDDFAIKHQPGMIDEVTDEVQDHFSGHLKTAFIQYDQKNK